LKSKRWQDEPAQSGVALTGGHHACSKRRAFWHVFGG